MIDENELKEEIKLIKLTRFLIELPETRQAIALIFILSGLVGIIGYFILGGDLFTSIIKGTFAGILVLGFPSLISAYVNTGVSQFTRKEIIYKRSFFLSLFGLGLVSILFLLGIATIIGMGNKYFFDIMIFAYVLVFSEQLVLTLITHPYNRIQSIMVSLVYPLVGILFLTPAISMGLFPIEVSIISLPIIFLKFVVGAVIFLMGVDLLLNLINAPMRRNFNVNAIKLFKLLLGHWYDYSSAIEDKLKDMGTKASTWVGIIAFKNKKGLKTLFITPYMHPGPLGEIGGSKLTKVLRDTIEEETNSKIVVTHGTVTFDLNPLTTDSLYRTCDRILEEIPSIKYHKDGTELIRTQDGDIKMLGQVMGDTVFMASTLNPKQTEDIDFAVGAAAMNEVKQSFPNAIYADCHNSYINAGKYSIYSSTPKFFNVLNASRKVANLLKKEKKGRIKMGFAQNLMDNYKLLDGIGPTGLRVIVLEVNKKRNAYVVFDANNVVTGLRDRMIERVKSLGLDDVEIMTTDSHCVNDLRGVENPLGERIDHEELINHAMDTTKKALEDLEDVEVGGKTILIEDIDVFGPERAAEIVTTIDSIVAVMKIAAPIIFSSSLFLALAAQLAIPW